MKRFLSIMVVLCLAVSSFGFTDVFALSETYQNELETNIAILEDEDLDNTDEEAAPVQERAARTLADGVYYIKNKNSGKYLQIRGDSTADDAIPEQWSQKSANPSGTNPNKLAQIWRVTYVNGYYIIRPLHMLNIVLLGVPATNIVVSELCSTDNVIAYSKWTIGTISDGYYIESAVVDKVLKVQNNSTSNGAALTMTETYTDPSSTWYFEQAMNVPTGIMVYNDQNTLVKGESISITASAYSPYLTSGTVTWQSSDTSVVSLSDVSGGTEIRLTKKNITGTSIGTSTLTITSASDSSVSTAVQIGVGEIANGTYFINSKSVLEKVIDIDGRSSNSGVKLIRNVFDGNAAQRWIFELQPDGYYTIKSVHSDLYISVQNNSSNNGAEIVQYSYSGDDGQKWKVIPATSGAFKLQSKFAGAQDLCLAKAPFWVLWEHLENKQYTNDNNYDDEWIFSDDVRLPEANGQNKTNWCWAASSKMVGEHNGGAGILSTTPAILTYTSGCHSYDGNDFYGVKLNGALTADGGQRDIVVYIYGDDDNHCGTLYDINLALQHASFNPMEIGTWGTGRLSNSDISAMNAELASGRWVVGCVHPHGGSEDHTIVIKSYDTTTEVYTYWDPWTNKTGTFGRIVMLNNIILLSTPTPFYTLAYVQYCN